MGCTAWIGLDFQPVQDFIHALVICKFYDDPISTEGQFTNVFNKNEHTQVPLLDRSAPFMNDIIISKDGVSKLLKSLNPSKAFGPDELHPRVLKELATELGLVFPHLFQTLKFKRNLPPFQEVTGHLRAIIAHFP